MSTFSLDVVGAVRFLNILKLEAWMFSFSIYTACNILTEHSDKWYVYGAITYICYESHALIPRYIKFFHVWDFWVLNQERCKIVRFRIILLMKSAFLILVKNTWWKWSEIWNLGNSLHPHKFWHIFTKVFNKHFIYCLACCLSYIWQLNFCRKQERWRHVASIIWGVQFWNLVW